MPETKLVAAVWEDGSTFGPDELLARIFDSRRTLADSYDRAIAMLQTGLEKNWTAEEYLAAAQQLKPPAPTQIATVEEARAASETLTAQGMPSQIMMVNMQRASQKTQPAANVAHIAQALLKEFAQARNSLRQALSGPTSSSGQLLSK